MREKKCNAQSDARIFKIKCSRINPVKTTKSCRFEIAKYLEFE